MTTTKASAPRARRQRGSGHELREVVIQVATDLLAEAGDVEGLTMRAVAAAAGVTPPSVYRHFPDKESLVRTVIGQRFAEFDDLLAGARADHHAPAERLRAIAQVYVRFGLEHPGHYRVLFSAVNAGPHGLGISTDTEHPAAASHRALVAAVADCLYDPDHTQALPLATELWASLHGVVDLRISKPELPWPEPFALVDTALVAVRNAAASPGSGQESRSA